MTIDAMRFMHPGKICICSPHLRDAKTRRVLTWHILRVVDSVDAARAALQRLELDGVRDAVPISMNEQIPIEADLAARFFRIYLGME